jgi:predicted helicase
MQTPLRQLLEQFRVSSKTEREKGTYFERLAVAFIKADPGMAQEYEEAWLFSDWAKQHNLSAADIGIDAVAKIRDEDAFCAIQCKFFAEGYRIQKKDIDSFLSSSQQKHFSRGIIIETTGAPWSPNAEALLDDLNITTIGLDRLEASPIDWAAWFQREEVKVAEPKRLRPHQIEALDCVRDGFAEADRGKLIMACGTGKTFTGLKIAEELVGKGGNVLVLVPSLALMSQTIREWTIDSQTPLRSYAVCSDAAVGKRRKDKNDVAEIELHDLDYPATTNATKLSSKASHAAPERMTVVFSTYQSIQVISDAQKLHGFPEFSLIICDEAHRTTGATLAGEDESNFVKVHDQDFIKSEKRLYMTATPRVFGDAVKAKAGEVSAVLASMDDEELYGKTLFTRGFGWAVENGLLTDYKVLVLAVDEAMVSGGVQNRLADGTSELKLDDATKIIGCYKALVKSDLKEELVGDGQPMQRALAFCKDIAASKLIRTEFQSVVSEYLASDEGQEALGDIDPLEVQVHHVDGTMGAKERTAHLDWLKETHDDQVARILSNARCLSEGVDVPALDAILFMHPRKSQIDVVQSVGRVMRRAEGKRMGYVILPIGVPAGVTPEDALNDNDRYRVVWQILNALRSHDERFDAMINKASLGVDVSDHIEVIAVSNKLPARKDGAKAKPNIGSGGSGDEEGEGDDGDSTAKPKTPFQGGFVFDEFSKAIMAKIVKKCGRRDYWEDWASDIAKIAQTHINRIQGLVEKPDTPEREAFEGFLDEIRDDLNESISEADAIEMLAQHLITRPVFEALFEDYSFAKNNPVSKAMQAVLEALDAHSIGKEAKSLERFYDSVRRRAEGIDKDEAKQKIIVELYDKFFRNAFPRMTERLGIVYTPVEVVDFILHSVDELLQSEFGQTLGSEGVHILDPFTGTGTFITRLLQSGLIKPEELERKYANEIHANEIVLLAYYIAAINIEAAYHSVAGDNYKPFEGICLTDTFQLYEQDKDLLATLMPDNSNRRTRQKELSVRVIVGNPPYSEGQANANDNAANLAYPMLDARVRDTYAARSDATNKNALYDSYIKAIRWASDRVGQSGVIGFVTNANWIDANTTSGLRKCLADECSSVHIFHLRGNARTAGELRRKEKDNVFGQGTRTPVAISLLVKGGRSGTTGAINFHDIGDYLSISEKLSRIRSLQSISGISRMSGWQEIVPDEHGDWLNQRDNSFDAYLPLGDKSAGGGAAIFSTFSSGVKTQRDAWAYNPSKSAVAQNMQSMITTYNGEVERFQSAYEGIERSAKLDRAGDFIDADPSKISWSRALIGDLVKDKRFKFDANLVQQGQYRPFTKLWLYYSRNFNEMVYQMPKFFPFSTAVKNRMICIAGPGAQRGFSPIMSETIPDLHIIQTGQCFPRFLIKPTDTKRSDEFDLHCGPNAADLGLIDGLTDAGLAHFQNAYADHEINKDDLFYYVYGILHSEDYCTRFADNLSKELPRIPAVKKAEDFWAFAKAGKRLGDLHCDYDSVAPFPVTLAEGSLELAHIPDPVKFYRVEKMRFNKVRNSVGKLEADKTTVIYNSNITITGIPLEAYDYVVNGKPALEWVIERQGVKTDKKSGITWDANEFANETVGDPAYPLKLFQRVITVSLETMEIVRGLPMLEI